MTYEKSIYYLKITIPLLIGLISFFLVAGYVSSPKYYENILASLDSNKESVTNLTASSTAVSVGITALPGDIATPIAEKLADLSFGFMIVLCAIYLEKFLLTITGMVVFKWLIPIACGVYILSTLIKKEELKKTAYKIAIMGFAIFLIIPISTKISDSIQSIYGSELIDTISAAQESAKLMEDSIAEENITDSTANGLGKVVESIKNAGGSFANGTSEFVKYLQRLVSRFLEALAILMVTACIIPILVLLTVVWLLKLLFLPELEFNVGKFDRFIRKGKFHNEN